MEPVLRPSLVLQLTLVRPAQEPPTLERSRPPQGARAASLEHKKALTSLQWKDDTRARDYLITEPFT